MLTLYRFQNNVHENLKWVENVITIYNYYIISYHVVKLITVFKYLPKGSSYKLSMLNTYQHRSSAICRSYTTYETSLLHKECVLEQYTNTIVVEVYINKEHTLTNSNDEFIYVLNVKYSLIWCLMGQECAAY